MPTAYRARRPDSKTKLRTWRDGARILAAAMLLFKEMRPLRFFTVISAGLTALAIGLGVIPVSEFIRTGLVLHFPTAILAASIQVVAFISLTAGIVLDSVCHGRRQAKRLVYLSLPPVRSLRARPRRHRRAGRREASGRPLRPPRSSDAPADGSRRGPRRDMAE